MMITIPTTRLLDWCFLMALVVMFGSAFLLTKIAVQEIPPMLVVAGRIVIGALILLVLALWQGERFASLKSCWKIIVVLAITGNCVPFFLITWGQQYVDSGLAGILMAMMPLSTILLAHFFVSGEHITANKLFGFLVGFAGVVILMLPQINSDAQYHWLHLVAMLSILSGAISYAINSVVAHQLPKMSLTLLSAGVLLAASVMILPIAIWSTYGWKPDVSNSSLLALLVLGLFPSGLATIIYFSLIRRAGAAFMSQTNYLIPLWAVFMGVAFGHEHISLNALIALTVILSGIALAQTKSQTQQT